MSQNSIKIADGYVVGRYASIFTTDPTGSEPGIVVRNISTIAQGASLGTNTQTLIGGSVTTLPPTYITGQISPLNLTTAGALRVSIPGKANSGSSIYNELAVSAFGELQVGNADAFGRQRVSEPFTIFDSKQLVDNQPLFWDDQQTSGAGTTSTYNTNQSSVTLAVGNLTAGTRIRQTFRRFNYQPGKSQLIMMTGILGSPATGITRRIGIFDAKNGLFFQSNASTLSVVQRSFTSGSAVDTVIDRASWNIDKLDGTGPSGVTIDASKTQIFIIDYQWLGVGQTRFAIFCNGTLNYVHRVFNANVNTTVSMSVPNLPLRYEISNSGAGGVASLVHICASVASEGAPQFTGRTFGVTRGIVPQITGNDTNIYPLIAIQLRTGYEAAEISIENMTLNNTTNSSYNWYLLLNPTIVGTALTFVPVTNSAIQADVTAVATTTLTGGTILATGVAQQTNESLAMIINPTDIKLGTNLAGTNDIIVLAVQRITGVLETFYGALNYREKM